LDLIEKFNPLYHVKLKVIRDEDDMEVVDPMMADE